jgi:hypothetical protein
MHFPLCALLQAHKAFQAQEKACEEAARSGRYETAPDTDPWLAGLKYQVARPAASVHQSRD